MEVRVKYGPISEQGTTTSSDSVQESFIRLSDAEWLRQEGKFDRAQRICEAIVRQHPHYASALHTLGLIHADRGNNERALDCLVRAHA